MSILAVVGRSPRTLVTGVLVGDVVDLSRQALVAFLRLRDVAAARPQLALWLFGPYLDALTVGRAAAADDEPSLVVDNAAPEHKTEERIATTIYTIERVLAAFHAEPDLSIASHLVDQRVIEPVVDMRGATGFAPLGGEKMPLNVRVLALVAAEMLTRPDRLRADLVAAAISVEIADRPVASGVAMRSRQTLPWSPARDEKSRAPGWPAAVAPTLAALVAAQDHEMNDDA